MKIELPLNATVGTKESEGQGPVGQAIDDSQSQITQDSGFVPAKVRTTPQKPKPVEKPVKM